MIRLALVYVAAWAGAAAPLAAALLAPAPVALQLALTSLVVPLGLATYHVAALHLLAGEPAPATDPRDWDGDGERDDYAVRPAPAPVRPPAGEPGPWRPQSAEDPAHRVDYGAVGEAPAGGRHRLATAPDPDETGELDLSWLDDEDNLAHLRAVHVTDAYPALTDDRDECWTIAELDDLAPEAYARVKGAGLEPVQVTPGQWIYRPINDDGERLLAAYRRGAL